MPKISTIFFEGNYSSVLGQLENEVEKPLSENQPEYKSLVWHYPFSTLFPLVLIISYFTLLTILK